MTPERVIVDSAYTLACTLPSSTVEALAAAILTTPPGSLRAEISKRVAHHQHRDLALAFVDRWRGEANGVDARTVAVALQTAALSEQTHRDSHSVELVWTGPDTEQTPFRRTEQAILQVLDAAKDRVTLVSFAVYRIPNVASALVRAAERGVKLTVIVETPDKERYAQPDRVHRSGFGTAVDSLRGTSGEGSRDVRRANADPHDRCCDGAGSGLRDGQDAITHCREARPSHVRATQGLVAVKKGLVAFLAATVRTHRPCLCVAA
jgi:hypothetical protein